MISTSERRVKKHPVQSNLCCSHFALLADCKMVVSFMSSPSFHTDSEVIVSGGTFETPKILMLSGIGDSAVLDSLGIPVVADVKGVGQNLQDRYGTGFLFCILCGLWW